MLLLLLFIGVAADSDDAHSGAGGVGNDYGQVPSSSSISNSGKFIYH